MRGWRNQSWHERMDDFRDEVNPRFDSVDRRFDRVDRELHRINDRLDGLHKILIYAILTLGSSTVAGWAAVSALLIART